MSLPGPQMEVVLRIARELKDKPGALLPILHGIQEELGFVPPDAVPVIADVLNMTRAEVHGVVTFYHDFRTEAPGRHVLKICQAESCQATGSVALTEHAKRKLGTDKSFTFEPVYCLGLCALSPSMMLDGEVFGRVSTERFNDIIQEASKAQ